MFAWQPSILRPLSRSNLNLNSLSTILITQDSNSVYLSLSYGVTYRYSTDQLHTQSRDEVSDGEDTNTNTNTNT
jgi:hypothetical protein